MLPPWITGKPHDIHPRLIENLAGLPDSLRGPAEAALPPDSSVTRIILVPADFRSKGLFGWRYVPEQALVFTRDGVLHVQGSGRRGVAAAATYLPHDCVLYVRSSLLLLYGRLEIAAAAGDEVTRIVVEYNTVGWRYIEPALKALVHGAAGAPRSIAGDLSAPARTQQILQALPYKFANGLRFYGVGPGEPVLSAVFQPAVWTVRWRFLYRQVAPNTLLALTDRSLVIIEEERALFRSSVEYGWIITYLALDRITRVEVKPKDQWQALTLRVERGAAATVHELTLEPGTAQAWQELWSMLPGKSASSSRTPVPANAGRSSA